MKMKVDNTSDATAIKAIRELSEVAEKNGISDMSLSEINKEIESTRKSLKSSNYDVKYYAVIDTNVLVSALLKWKSIPGKVVIQALEGNILPLLSDTIMSEYTEVLNSKKFNFPKKSVKTFLQGIAKRGIFIDTNDVKNVTLYHKDTVLYFVVMEYHQTNDFYILNGNKIANAITPQELLNILKQ